MLTESRKAYANAVATAVACGLPVLLEGPAAVGKTELIRHLAAHMYDSPVLLERVNNSESTSHQDYFGSYLPQGKAGFRFMEGPLLR